MNKCAHAPIVDSVLAQSSAHAHDQSCIRDSGGFTRQIRSGDRLLAVNESCIDICSVIVAGAHRAHTTTSRHAHTRRHAHICRHTHTCRHAYMRSALVGFCMCVCVWVYLCVQAQELRCMLLGPSGTTIILELALTHNIAVDHSNTPSHAPSFVVILVRGGSGLCLAQKDAGTLHPDLQ